MMTEIELNQIRGDAKLGAIRLVLKSILLRKNPLSSKIVKLTTAAHGPVALLLLVRDEADIIADNIRFHQARGVDYFIITDNASLDGTRDLLADLSRNQNNFLVIDEPGRDHAQDRWVTRMASIARERYKANWVILSDADEFWFPASGNYFSEADNGANMFNCYWRNFMPAQTHWKEFNRIGDMLTYNSRMSKVFCSTFGLFGTYIGNHEVRIVPRINQDSSNIIVYHYPCRSFEQFERKIVNGFQAVMNNPNYPISAATQWRDCYRAYQEGRLREVYNDLSYGQSYQDDAMKLYFSAGSCA
jgi:hypothetical protein